MGQTRVGRKPISLSTQPAYHRFVSARNQALETLLQNTLVNISQSMDKVFRDAELFVSRLITMVPDDMRASFFGKQSFAALESGLEAMFDEAKAKIIAEHKKLIRQSNLLAHSGETQAIASVTGKQLKAQITRLETDPKFEARVNLAFARITRKIRDALEAGFILEDSARDLMVRVSKAFPRVKRFKRPPRVVRALKEADAKIDASLSTIEIGTDEDWQDVLDNSLDVKRAKLRGPSTVFDVPDQEGDLVEWYGWEVEQDITNDFVNAVRQGQVQAANEAGIEEFVWIAVVDNKTDECCLWRDGLTITEIEDKLKSEHADDECEATVPPAHFNCRCDIAPALSDLPEKPASNQPEFDEWLTNS